MLSILGFVTATHGQDAYPIAYNIQFVPNHEYINTMSMSSQNKEYYSFFIVAFQNKFDQKLPINDAYEIITSKGEKHKAGLHPFVKSEIEAKRKFSAVSGKIKFIGPGETRYVIAIFDHISDNTPSFQFRIRGLPDQVGQPDKQMVVVDYEHLKTVVEKNAAFAKDTAIVWEPEPIPYNPNRQIAHWRMKKMLRQNAQ